MIFMKGLCSFVGIEKQETKQIYLFPTNQSDKNFSISKSCKKIIRNYHVMILPLLLIAWQMADVHSLCFFFFFKSFQPNLITLPLSVHLTG